jgi:hypothetical protein
VLDRFEGLARGNETDTEFVAESKNLLVEKPGVQPEDDRYRSVVR